MLTISEDDAEGDSLASRETSYNTLNEAKDKLQKTIRVKFDQVPHLPNSFFAFCTDPNFNVSPGSILVLSYESSGLYFTQAVHSGDGASVERFFKIFLRINFWLRTS